MYTINENLPDEFQHKKNQNLCKSSICNNIGKTWHVLKVNHETFVARVINETIGTFEIILDSFIRKIEKSYMESPSM